MTRRIVLLVCLGALLLIAIGVGIGTFIFGGSDHVASITVHCVIGPPSGCDPEGKVLWKATCGHNGVDAVRLTWIYEDGGGSEIARKTDVYSC
jgi:hypothetical protein